MAILKPSPGSPSTFSAGTRTSVEVQLAQVVAAQAHRVEALADLEALHVLLDDERGVAALAVGSVAAKVTNTEPLLAVADVVLLAVQPPRAVGLALGAGLHAVHVGAGLGLGEREAGELAPAAHRSGRKRSFCSSVPNRTMPFIPIDWCTPMITDSVGSIWANTSDTRQ